MEEVPSATRSAPVPRYASGAYFGGSNRHAQDAPYKADAFCRFFLPSAQSAGWPVRSYVDVGCGSGDATRLVAAHLTASGVRLERVSGYDVSPHVDALSAPGVDYVHADFARADDEADLVTLFDVIEHVPDPLAFLGDVAERANVLGLHIPLDRSALTGLRDGYRSKLHDPGHLLFLDAADALNLMALAGLLVFDYAYSPTFTVASERESPEQRALYPFRRLLWGMSPWLLSRTFGGVSLFVLALTPRGVARGYSTVAVER